MSTEVPPSLVCATCGTPIQADAVGGACPLCLLTLGLYGSLKENGLSGRTLDELRRHFAHLSIHALIGTGGTAQVYRARDDAHNREIALKILPVEHSADPQFAARFAREAETLAQLDHPGIVKVYESGRSGDYLYITMELVSGSTLREVMRREKIDSERTIQIISQICEAVEFAHSRGIVHRDLKPENVLIDPSGHVKIADFGIAKLLKSNASSGLTLTETGLRFGTRAYMAPEQMRGEREIDGRTDIYTVGVLLYELLTDERPLPDFLPPSKAAGVDSRFNSIVARCLKRSPEERFKSAREIIARLDEIGRPRKPIGRIASLMVLAIGAAAIFWWLRATPYSALEAPAGTAARFGSDEWMWTEPENLGPLVNTPSNDHHPSLSADGLTLVYHGRGVDLAHDVDIWQCRRASIAAPWGKPENFGPPINSPQWEGDPCLSADGCTLVFASEHRNGEGAFDLFMAQRPSIDRPWSEPVSLGIPINTVGQDRSPALSADGLTLWYTQYRTPAETFDLMFCRRRDAKSPFGAPTPAEAPVNSPHVETDCAISSDGLLLLWTVPFTETAADPKIWWSCRATANSLWQPPQRLPPEINEGDAAEPFLSTDGRELYFVSNRAGGSGGTDLWVSRLVRRPSPAATEPAESDELENSSSASAQDR